MRAYGVRRVIDLRLPSEVDEQSSPFAGDAIYEQRSWIDVEAEIVRVGWLLLDFDGPISDVYAGLPDHVVAQRLRDVLWYASLQTTAIVSNNSAEAIDRFFDLNLP